MGQIEFHPLANLFPMMDDASAGELAEDIGERGQEVPIVLYESMILDGRNRFLACMKIGYRPKFVEYTGDDPLGFVVSTNLQRRHLTESQRAMIAASLVSLSKGMRKCLNPESVTYREASGKLSISERAIRAARSIRDAGAPSLIDAIRDGRVSVHSGEALKHLPDPDVQRLLKAGDRAVMDTAKALRTEKMTASRAGKLSLMAAISARGMERATPGTLPKKAFAVMYADVPWPDEDVWSDETGKDRAYPYPTMTLDEIKALCAGDASPALDDAVLFAWRTANRVRQALDFVEAWGFEVVTEIVWGKVNRGTGRWVIDCHEVLMICKRGNPPCPLPGTQPLSLYSEAKTAHSAKPTYFREMIDTMFPGLPKLELFGRGQAPDGWTFWGFEAEGQAGEIAEAVPPAKAARKRGKAA